LKVAWVHIVLLLFIRPASAQVFQDLKFSHISDKDGLSNNNVLSINTDQDGILWFGTESGLNRFDGYGIKNFYALPNDPESIPNGFISQIIADKKNNLWISTTEGIFYFDTKTHHSMVFKSDPGDHGAFRNDHRPLIYLDSSQLPWVDTYDGLYHFIDSMHYERTNKGIMAYSHLTKKETNVYSEYIKDKTGQFWCYWDNSIFRVNSNTKELMETYKCPDQILIRHIFFDSHNRCWVSTWGKGIYVFDPSYKKWQSFGPSKQLSVVYGATEWVENGRKMLVFSNSTPGLFFVDENDLSTGSYLFDGANVSLTGPPFVDSQNILWITSTNGIYYTTPSDNLFSVIPVPPLLNKQGQKISAFVYNMEEEKSGYWISKRYYGGICWYDKNWKLIKSWLRIPIGPGKRFPGLDSTTDEAYDFKQVGDNMFITTEAGIAVLNLNNYQWTAFSPTDVSSEPRLRTIIVENDRTWWIRSFDQGIFIFNPLTKQFVAHYRNDDSCRDCLPGHIDYLFRDKQQRLFATTNGGLYVYNKRQDRFLKIRMSGAPTPSNVLFGLTEDSKGLMWIGAENGLFVFNPDNNEIEKAFSENNKIGIVSRICTDPDENIWFTSNTGYWCWLRKPDKVISFEYSLGLPKTDGGIFFKTSDGSVYAGGKDAVVRFYPDLLMNYKMEAKTKIIEAVMHDSLTPFKTNGEGQKELTVPPGENSININFDVINYDLVSANQFYYKLSPGDKRWNQSRSGHLTFYGLQPGHYILEVKGASKLTGNFTNTDTLRINVRKFWYQSDWFKFICILIGSLILLGAVRYRIQVIRKEGLIKQRISEVEMTALRAQMSPHFIFNSLNSIENFMMQNEKRLAVDYLNKFARLIRMILENSRQPVVPIANDMEAMQLYIDLEKLRFEDKFQYITDIDNILLTGDYRVPPLLIQPFVENAIIHGIAPGEQKDFYLRISVKYHTDHIQYMIEDNGIGRVASLAYTKKKKSGHKSLGLQISQERIDILNRKNKNDVTLEIIDLYDENRQATGTRINLTLKTT
jgi:ligand-binding sensor domain-containing protein